MSLITESSNRSDFVKKLELKNINLYYSLTKQILKDVSIEFYKNKVTSLIGPSGCGKSSLLKTINRINDYIQGFRYEGEILLDGQNINDLDVTILRLLVGMVFQKPTPFPGSIYKNVAFGPRIHELYKSKADLDNIVEASLSKAGLWNEVKDKLHDNATSLSGGQQQRLCIARTIAIKPDVILMDEPCSALDPIATAKVEELINELRQEYTIIIVTHSMGQAARISDYTAFLYLGELIEFAPTENIFTNPKNKLTENYINGKIG
jgi:phosphate transport system ATP-binding protein